jgi:hypothetical protein
LDASALQVNLYVEFIHYRFFLRREGLTGAEDPENPRKVHTSPDIGHTKYEVEFPTDVIAKGVGARGRIDQVASKFIVELVLFILMIYHISGNIPHRHYSNGHCRYN